MGPVGRFSLALAVVLALTASAVALTTSLFVGRYIEDETARVTERAVASHFGPIFAGDVFVRPLEGEEYDELEGMVLFHFSIYNVVRTRFVSTDGRIVFSYDEDELGRSVAQDQGFGAALAGSTFAARELVVADVRRGDPSKMRATMPHDGYRAYATLSGRGWDRSIPALEAWVPVRDDAGRIAGVAAVWRDMRPVDAEIQRMQLATSAIIAVAAVLLWAILRGVYVRSSQEIRRRSHELAAALVETERSYDATLSALSNALDVRDSETEGHARRVVQYLELVADELGSPLAERTALLRGALLHDVGKIGVPDDILRKAGPLSATEWSTMRRHPSYGARIVAGIPFLEAVAVIIKHHHERWDGAGYPDGLRGEEIPFGARMFAVADAFDAMTADRPYRRALDAPSARLAILNGSGTQFDPRVVDAFMRIPLERLLRVAPHEEERAATPLVEAAIA
jgi:putative nucleotidyltransferase with HDIG domain